MFKIKFEIKFKNEKDNLINENTIKLKKLEKEVNEMENNIKILNLKDNEINLKINNLSKKEKQLNDTIKQFESYKSIAGDSKSSINNNSIYESLENTIDSNKQQREEKQKIINNFIFNVNELLNEYQNYIDILINNKMNINNPSDNSNSNKSSIKIKDKDDSSNTGN
jgi:chromosome segregation ATPase